MKKTSIFASLCLILLVLPITALAYTHQTGNIVTVPEGETIEGNYYAAGSIITIDGDINGDVFLAGQNITINGKVSGDVFAGGENITLNGDIGSSLRVAGANININGNVAHSVMGLGANVTLAKDANVGWDFLFAGAIGNLLGNIGLDLHGGGAYMNIAGEVGRDVKLRLGENDSGMTSSESGLTVADSAIINGNLYYTAANKGSISSQAEIKGELGFKETNYDKTKRETWKFAWGGLFSIFSLYVVGLVIVSLWRKQIAGINEKMINKTAASIGIGALIVVLTPLTVLLLMFTIIGIPLSLILIVVWLIAMYSSKIVAGILVGKNLLTRFSEKKKDSMIYAMIIGVLIVWAVCSLPLIGWILSLIVVWWSLGGMWLYFKGDKKIENK
jgi:hypothetical protein